MSQAVHKLLKSKIVFPRPSLHGLAETDFVDGKKIMIETGLGDLIQKEVLRRAIKNPKDYESLLPGITSEETLLYIRDTSIPLKERNLRLREYLLDSLIVLNNIFPRLTDENLIHYAKLINKACVDDNRNGFNSELTFSSNLDFSPQVFFGITSHEFEHLAILDNFSNVSPAVYEQKPLSSTEEFVCDLSALNSLCYIAKGNLSQRENYPDDYLQAVQRKDPFIQTARKYGFSFDYHHVGRASLFDLIEQFENLGIQKAELIPVAYKCAKEVLQNYKTGEVKRKGIRFPQFLEDLCGKLEAHLPVKIKIKAGEVEITEEVLKQFREETLSANNLTEEQIDSIKEGKMEKLPIVLVRELK